MIDQSTIFFNITNLFVATTNKRKDNQRGCNLSIDKRTGPSTLKTLLIEKKTLFKEFPNYGLRNFFQLLLNQKCTKILLP